MLQTDQRGARWWKHWSQRFCRSTAVEEVIINWIEVAYESPDVRLSLRAWARNLMVIVGGGPRDNAGEKTENAC